MSINWIPIENIVNDKRISPTAELLLYKKGSSGLLYTMPVDFTLIVGKDILKLLFINGEEKRQPPTENN